MRMTCNELLKACENNDFIIIRDYNCEIGINCKVAFTKIVTERRNANNTGITSYISFRKCNFSEYISFKTGFLKRIL